MGSSIKTYIDPNELLIFFSIPYVSAFVVVKSYLSRNATINSPTAVIDYCTFYYCLLFFHSFILIFFYILYEKAYIPHACMCMLSLFVCSCYMRQTLYICHRPRISLVPFLHGIKCHGASVGICKKLQRNYYPLEVWTAFLIISNCSAFILTPK